MYIDNTNITNYVDLTQVGNSSFTGAITADGVINANAGINIGSTANTDTTKIIQNVVNSNITELALYNGNEGTTTSTVTLPIPEEAATRDYVTVRSTNAGVHHAFSTTGNYYYGNSIVPSYSSLPTLTTLQIGGSTSATFSISTYAASVYHYVSVSLPKGYFLVLGELDFASPTAGDYITYGLSTK